MESTQVSERIPTKMNAANADQFESFRPLMFSIAYRMLGTVEEAEDIVQKAYLRYQAVPSEQIVSPKAFLSTIVTRLCLNQLELAHTQRETYIGPWLPEPVLTATDEQPAQQAELHDSLSLAFLVLLEDLTPLERAVFLLREVFDYDYAEVASITGQQEAACRQVLSRARKHIAERRPRFKPSPDTHRQMLNQFLQAINSGELTGLMQLLTDEVTLQADSGGKVRGALMRVLQGREPVAKYLIASTRFAPSTLTPEISDVNGEPTLLLRAEGMVFIVISLSVENGHVSAVRVIGNPDKLKSINRANHGTEGQNS